MQTLKNQKRGTVYSKFLGILTHLIFRKPEAIKKLLEDFGVKFASAVDYKVLIGATVDLLAKRDPEFENELGELLSLHVRSKSDELKALENQEDQFFGGLVGGLVKGALGGLFKGKKRRGGGAAATANNVKNDMNQQLVLMQKQMEMRQAQARQDRLDKEAKEESERKRKEQKEELRERKEAAARKRMNQNLMIGGIVVVLGIVAYQMFFKPAPIVATKQ